MEAAMCWAEKSTAGNFPFVLAGNAQRSNEVKMRRGRASAQDEARAEKKARRGKEEAEETRRRVQKGEV
jgi:hypothetical protein